jgi:hypothetical protein
MNATYTITYLCFDLAEPQVDTNFSTMRLPSDTRLQDSVTRDSEI